jgi:hypothetical protein
VCKNAKITLAVALPLAAAGAVYAVNATKHREAKPSQPKAGYVCPLTGEVLPSPECCPLNKSRR